MTVRDDQQEFDWLLEAARAARKRRRRFRLVDSGKLETIALEWLAKAGADLYTGDDVRADGAALIRIRQAGRASGAVTVFFHHGPLDTHLASPALAQEEVREVIRSGIDFHLSNREKRREAAVLLNLANERRAGRAQVVYYHHGLLDKALEDLVGAGAWVHVSNMDFNLKEDFVLLRDISRTARRGPGGGLAVHVEKGDDQRLLEDIRRAGAFLLHKLPLSGRPDRKSLPFRAYYLDTTFLP